VYRKVVTFTVINMSPSPFGSQDLTMHGTNTRREGLSLVANVFMVASVETFVNVVYTQQPFIK